MAAGGEQNLDDDGAVRLNDAGERVMDNFCPQPCATQTGLGSSPFSYFPGEWCRCCAPTGWTVTIEGNESNGAVIQHVGPIGTNMIDTATVPSANGTYNVIGPWWNSNQPGDYFTFPSDQQYFVPLFNGPPVSDTGGSGPLTLCGRCSQWEWGTTPHYSTPGDSGSTLTSLDLWIRVFAYPMQDFTKGGSLNVILYAVCTMLPDEDGIIRYECDEPLIFGAAGDPYLGVTLFNGQPMARMVCGGGTVTVTPCNSGPMTEVPVLCGISLCDTEYTICISTFTTSTAGYGDATEWLPWSGGGTTPYGAGDTLPSRIGEPIITRTPGGGCTAEISVFASQDSDGNCIAAETPTITLPPCPPPRFCCVEAWRSTHYVTGWSTPVKIAGGAFCVDTDNPSVNVNGWGPIEDGCQRFFYRFLGECDGPDDVSSCVGLHDDVAPDPPTDEPDCYAENLAGENCENCCDQYTVTIGGGGSDPWCVAGQTYTFVRNNPAISGSGCEWYAFGIETFSIAKNSAVWYLNIQVNGANCGVGFILGPADSGACIVAGTYTIDEASADFCTTQEPCEPGSDPADGYTYTATIACADSMMMKRRAMPSALKTTNRDVQPAPAAVPCKPCQGRAAAKAASKKLAE